MYDKSVNREELPQTIHGKRVIVERDAPNVDLDAAAKALMRLVTDGDPVGYVRKIQASKHSE